MTEPDTNSTLTDAQLKALPFFINAGNDAEGCRHAKISRETYYRWIKEPVFKERLRELRNIAVNDAVEALKRHASKAVATLATLMDSENEAIQRGASNDILDRVAKFIEIQEFEVRIKELENCAAQRGWAR